MSLVSAVISTSDPSIGGIDNINVGLGEDIVFGGIAADTIVAGDGNDVVVGDNGIAQFNDLGLLDSVSTTDIAIGGADQITAGSNDVIVGGVDADTVSGGTGNDGLLVITLSC